MLRFHASIRGEQLKDAASLRLTFDEAAAALQQLERMFIEPDGSFVWTGTSADAQSWQVDGNLIDRGDALAYVELHGRCPENELDRLLSLFGAPDTTLRFHLPQSGRLLAEAEFRRMAATDSGAV